MEIFVKYKMSQIILYVVVTLEEKFIYISLLKIEKHFQNYKFILHLKPQKLNISKNT